MKTRDMSKKQFLAALAKHGMSMAGFMGYVNLGIPGEQISVSHWNAGDNFRAKLAHLLRERDKWIAKIEKERAA